MRPLVMGTRPTRPVSKRCEESGRIRRSGPGRTDVHFREPVSPTSSQVCGQPLPFDLRRTKGIVRRQRKKSTKLRRTAEGSKCPVNSDNAGARGLFSGERRHIRPQSDGILARGGSNLKTAEDPTVGHLERACGRLAGDLLRICGAAARDLLFLRAGQGGAHRASRDPRYD